MVGSAPKPAHPSEASNVTSARMTLKVLSGLPFWFLLEYLGEPREGYREGTAAHAMPGW